jgi:hypothetical protein
VGYFEVAHYRYFRFVDALGAGGIEFLGYSQHKIEVLKLELIE